MEWMSSVMGEHRAAPVLVVTWGRQRGNQAVPRICRLSCRKKHGETLALSKV
jgi:hypothetical protein